MNYSFAAYQGLLLIGKVVLVLLFPLSMLIALIKLLFVEYPSRQFYAFKKTLNSFEGQLLAKLPQEYRELVQKPDIHGLYHNIDYLKSLRLSDLLKDWTLEQLADLSDYPSRFYDKCPWMATAYNSISVAIEELLYKKKVTGEFNELGDAEDLDVANQLVANLKKWDFFANYKNPSNATEVGNLAYSILHAPNISYKLIANQIYLTWKSRASELT